MFRATVESVNGHTFHLAFRDDTCCVQVQRGMDRLKELDESLLNSFSVLYESTPMISLGEEPTPDDLERYLNFWLGLYGESVTIFDDFNRFMEEPTSHSEIAQLQHNFLRWKVSLWATRVYFLFLCVTFCWLNQINSRFPTLPSRSAETKPNFQFCAANVPNWKK